MKVKHRFLPSIRKIVWSFRVRCGVIDGATISRVSIVLDKTKQSGEDKSKRKDCYSS